MSSLSPHYPSMTAESAASSRRQSMVSAVSTLSAYTAPESPSARPSIDDEDAAATLNGHHGHMLAKKRSKPRLNGVATASALPAHLVAESRQPSLAVPSHAIGENGSTSTSRQASLTVPSNHHLSTSSSSLARTSLNSSATSNSSYMPRRNSGHAHSTASTYTRDHYLASSSRTSAQDEVDITAALIRRLYEKLDVDGVEGDGWRDGEELTRDGIINREGCQRLAQSILREGKTVDLTDKEENVLRRLDRYGFFASEHPSAQASQCARVATLRAAPFSILTDATFGKARRKGSRAVSSRLPSQSERPHEVTSRKLDSTVELSRISKWAEMLRPAQRDAGGNVARWSWAPGWSGRKRGDSNNKYRKLQRRVFKGIPDRWRMAAWQTMMDDMLALNPHKYDQSDDSLRREYHELVARESSQDVQIDLDVPRTISGNILFHTRYGRGQRALFHVLHAVGLRSDMAGHGGYCQGMGPIAASFLCYFEPERAFVSMCRIFDTYELGAILEPGFPGLRELFYIQSELVQFLMPSISAVFDKHEILTDAYATKWYITLFANSLPFDSQLRIWDALLLEGIDILVVVSLAVIWSFRDEFERSDATFESILSALTSYFTVEDNDAMMRWIRKTWRRKDVRTRIDGARKEWRAQQPRGTT